jgi:hypothetical protein
MNAADFDLNLSLPAERRFAKTMGELAAHAAKYAGGEEDVADSFGATVERIVHECVDRLAPGTEVPIVLRRDSGPLEFLIGCDIRFDPKQPDRRIRIDWTHDDGRRMCRVTLEMV